MFLYICLNGKMHDIRWKSGIDNTTVSVVKLHFDYRNKISMIRIRLQNVVSMQMIINKCTFRLK